MPDLRLPEPSDRLDEAYARNQAYLSMLKSRFTVPHLIAVYHRFGGDMVLVIVLGEIALRNFQRMLETDVARPYRILDAQTMAAIQREGLPQQGLSPATVATIARATGVPRETVRRKVAALVKRDWVVRDPDGTLRLGAGVGTDLREFDRQESLAFARAALALNDLLGAVTPTSA